jgi:hypothetical protein
MIYIFGIIASAAFVLLLLILILEIFNWFGIKKRK